MSWTIPTSWTNGPRDLAGVNEIVNAWSERLQVLTGSGVGLLSAGDNAQDTGYWSGFQTWLESNCTSFIDHVNGPFDGDGNWLYFTLATWRAVAGLPVDGFRRCVARNTDTTPIFTTGGIMQFGDYRGTWNFEDLQKGLGVLKWTLRDATSVASQGMYGNTQTVAYGLGYWNRNNQALSDPAFFATEQAHWDSINADWTDLVWSDNPMYFYQVNAIYTYSWPGYPPPVYGGNPVDTRMYKGRARFKASITDIPALSHAAELYVHFIGGQNSVHGEIAFTDIDDEGIHAGWNAIESFGSSSSTSHDQTNYFGDHTTDPLLVAGGSERMNEVSGDNGGGGTYYNGGINGIGARGDDIKWLMKWEFTNS